jgi:hypothetical protein
MERCNARETLCLLVNCLAGGHAGTTLATYLGIHAAGGTAAVARAGAEVLNGNEGTRANESRTTAAGAGNGAPADLRNRGTALGSVVPEEINGAVYLADRSVDLGESGASARYSGTASVWPQNSSPSSSTPTSITSQVVFDARPSSPPPVFSVRSAREAMVEPWMAQVKTRLLTLSVAKPADSVADPSEGTIESVRYLAKAFDLLSLANCGSEKANRYKQLLDYLVEGGSHCRLELLCDRFDDSTWDESLRKEELEEIKRLLERVDATDYPIAHEIDLLYRFAEKGLDPRRSDVIMQTPLVDVVKVDCTNQRQEHFLSRATLRNSIASIGRKCPVCNLALREGPGYVEAPQEMKSLVAEYAGHQAKQLRP